MKKILLSIFTLAIVGLLNKVEAQCTIAQSSISVDIKTVTSNPGGGCTTVFDLTFDASINGGNEWTNIHIWDAIAAPNPQINWNGKPKVSKAMLEDGVDNEIAPLLQTISLYYKTSNTVSSTFPFATGITPYTTNVSFTKTVVGSLVRFSIKNISVTTTHCDPLNLKFDVWSAQNSQNVACGTSGLSARADEPLLRGLMQCVNPRTFTLSIQTKETRDVEFIAYKDVAPLGVFDANDQANVVYGPTTVENIGDPTGLIYNNYGPFPYAGGDVVGNKFNVWVKASTEGILNSNTILIDNTCAPLPVKLKSFTASRKQTNVELKWTTTMEQNNSGFELQRQSGAGGWQRIGFVNSKAADGNSTSDLNYTYTDANDSRGVSQYRLMQVDMDDQAKYSDIRSVQGIGQEARTIISPNPSANGRVNVTFQSASSKKDLQLTDMHGRMLKQWNAYSDNSLQITDLTPGIYQLKITDRETGTQTVEKIMVVNR